MTVGLPPVGEQEAQGGDYHHQAPGWTGAPNREAEVCTGLAIAKPDDIEYETQPRVSCVFYPAENHALY